MSIESLGWNAAWELSFTVHRQQGREPARVSGQDRERYDVLDGEGGTWPAEVAGRMRHEARGPSDFPAVGDWVALDPSGHDGPRRIVAVLPRVTAFVRKQAGKETEAQVIAANLDAVFVVTGLDGDFNVRRIERYLATVWDGGAMPVVVLNKRDLVEDLEARIAEVEAGAPGVPVIAVSATQAFGLDALEPWLGPGRTVALLGSSGAGKSTLVNALLGVERQRTSPVREWDSRGRHTTTRRELVPLSDGAWLIDTPGIRQLQLWAEEGSLDQSFPEIAELAAQCRFRDCRHQTEPGCEVRLAEREGRLAAERVASWRKLQRELRWLEAKQDRHRRAAEEARWRAIARAQRQHQAHDPKRWRDGGSHG